MLEFGGEELQDRDEYLADKGICAEAMLTVLVRSDLEILDKMFDKRWSESIWRELSEWKFCNYDEFVANRGDLSTFTGTLQTPACGRDESIKMVNGRITELFTTKYDMLISLKEMWRIGALSELRKLTVTDYNPQTEEQRSGLDLRMLQHLGNLEEIHIVGIDSFDEILLPCMNPESKLHSVEIMNPVMLRRVDLTPLHALAGQLTVTVDSMTEFFLKNRGDLDIKVPGGSAIPADYVYPSH